jgi:hypothetical protein
VTAAITIPTDTSPGPHQLTFTGYTGGQTTTLALGVANPASAVAHRPAV